MSAKGCAAVTLCTQCVPTDVTASPQFSLADLDTLGFLQRKKHLGHSYHMSTVKKNRFFFSHYIEAIQNSHGIKIVIIGVNFGCLLQMVIAFAVDKKNNFFFAKFSLIYRN